MVYLIYHYINIYVVMDVENVEVKLHQKNLVNQKINLSLNVKLMIYQHMANIFMNTEIYQHIKIEKALLNINV